MEDRGQTDRVAIQTDPNFHTNTWGLVAYMFMYSGLGPDSNRSRDAVLGKLFTLIVPLFS